MDTLFGPAIEPIDPLLEQLLRYKETGVIYGKRDLAAKMGIQPGQLDSLAAKYHIEPFWRQIRQERSRCIRFLLTDNEYDVTISPVSPNISLMTNLREMAILPSGMSGTGAMQKP